MHELSKLIIGHLDDLNTIGNDWLKNEKDPMRRAAGFGFLCTQFADIAMMYGAYSVLGSKESGASTRAMIIAGTAKKLDYYVNELRNGPEVGEHGSN